jgi:YARHG domain
MTFACLAPRGIRAFAAAAIITAATLAAPSSASAQTCQSLWVERNSYYKAAGYCFKTARAISYFGNGGCRFDNEASVPLSRAVRARIAEIIRLEHRLGCE